MNCPGSPWIFECFRSWRGFAPQVAEPAEEEGVNPDERTEAPGMGLNEYVYFVSNTVDGEWTQLPNVKPIMIQTAR